MAVDFFALLLAGFAAFLTVLWRMTKRDSRLPPGPPSYPLVGSMFSVDFTDFLGAMRQLRKQYGNLYSIMISYKPMIIVSGHKATTELLHKYGDVLSDRPTGNYFMDVDLENKGIIGSNGSLWKDHRTFSLTALRSFGFGKRRFEDGIAEEVTHFLHAVEDQGGKPFYMHDIVTFASSNIMCSISFGRRYDYNDKHFLQLRTMMTNISTMGSQSSGLVVYFPWMRKLPGLRSWSNEYLGYRDQIVEFITGIVEEHKATFDEDDVRDYIDSYLVEQKKLSNIPDSTFTDDQLITTVRDFFQAGSETSSATIQWACLFFIERPDVQTRMRKEIEEVVGTNRRPTLSDRQHLHYCEAVISEIQRCANVAPLPGLHTATQDVEWDGYVIPKDAIVIFNLDSVQYDPEVFPEPRKFKPERFLTEDGKFTGSKNTMVFGHGHRKCLGESIAMMEVYLIITALIQKFEIRPDVDNKVPKVKGTFGLIWVPEPFSMRAVPVEY